MKPLSELDCYRELYGDLIYFIPHYLFRRAMLIAEIYPSIASEMLLKAGRR
jgi:hypothetical protein